MGKIIKLTESQVKLVVKDIIKEAAGYNENVAKIQSALKSAGNKYANLLGKSGPNQDGVDGVYGGSTKAAIRQFQIDNGIKPTGFVGKVTAPKLGVSPMSSSDASNKSEKPSSQNDDPKKGKATGDVSGTNDASVNLQISKDTTVSPSISPDVKGKINWNKISTTDSVAVGKAAQPECAKFVNDFSERIHAVGNAWHAHGNETLGKNVWSAFRNLTQENVDKIFELWKRMEKAGAGKENGSFNKEVKNLVNSLVPTTLPVKLELDDVVGIFYPPSSHHEEAFMQSSKLGKGYFIKDASGNWTKGKTISGGTGFGMNTHIGIVGAIKNGVPIIFHNVKGTVFSDPANRLYNRGRVAWVRRPGAPTFMDDVEGVARKAAKKVRSWFS